MGGPEGPFAAVFIKLLEDMLDEQQQFDVERRLAAIERAFGNNPEALRENLEALFATVAEFSRPSELRHATSCLVVMRALSTRSRHATDWDPHLDEDDLGDVLRGVPGIASLEREVQAIVHELHRVGFVKRRDTSEGTSIGPADDFFARTDALFQPWNPHTDARELCTRARASGEDRILPELFDAELGWGSRRMNAALALLISEGVADDTGGTRTAEYLTWEMMLTPEATFFIEQEP